MSPVPGFEAVVGLEVHAQLRTRRKLFCGCPHSFGAPPNSQVCEVCLGYPGALPVLDREAVGLAVDLALALAADIDTASTFDRKHYFYPDLPKGYQITQQRRPLARGGRLPVPPGGNSLPIARLHLEEDSGRLLHTWPAGQPASGPGDPDVSYLDFNRAGAALVEIVSRPTVMGPEQAKEALVDLHRLLLATRASDGRMAEGSLRCDVNISLRPRGSERLGERVELKNLNSFRHVQSALDFEIRRQTAILSDGGRVESETRSWNPRTGRSHRMRGKESGLDYRYLEEPDLPPLVLDPSIIQKRREQLPELPWNRQRRFAIDYALGDEAARRLTQEPALADYVDAVVSAHGGPAATPVQWIQNDVLRLLKEDTLAAEVLDDVLPPGRLASLVTLVGEGKLSRSAGKAVLDALWRGGRKAEAAEEEAVDELEPEATAQRLGLLRTSDPTRLGVWIEETVSEFPNQVQAYRAGKEELLGFFMGQVMQRSGGSADPREARSGLRRILDVSADVSVKDSVETGP